MNRSVMLVLELALALTSWTTMGSQPTANTKAMLGHGRHLVTIAGCDDCHTAATFRISWATR
ncbi:MAG: hypothetical protein ACRETA_01270 [Gammaproteobacteria bacterium]